MSRKRSLEDLDFSPSPSLKKPRSVAPKPTPVAAQGGGGGGGSRMSKEAIRKANHSMIERRRREKMNACFGELRGMIPGLAGGGSEDGKGVGGGEFKLEVLERAVDYMKSLITRLDILESQPSQIQPSHSHPSHTNPRSHSSSHRGSSSRSSSRGHPTHRGNKGVRGGRSAGDDEDGEGEEEGDDEDEDDAEEEEEEEEEQPPTPRQPEISPPPAFNPHSTSGKKRQMYHPSPPYHPSPYPTAPPTHAPPPPRPQVSQLPSSSSSPTSSLRSILHSPAPAVVGVHQSPQRGRGDSEITLEEEDLPLEGSLHPTARSVPAVPIKEEGRGDRGGSSADSSSPSFEKLPSLPSPPSHPSPQTILDSVPRRPGSTSPNGMGLPFSRFAHPNLPSSSGTAAATNASFSTSLSSLQNIRNPNIYLPPPLPSASPTSPFFQPAMSWGTGGMEPSPMLPPLGGGLGSLFPGVGGMGGSVGFGGEETPTMGARTTEAVISSGASNGSGISNLTSISPFLNPSPYLDPTPPGGGHNTFEHKAANILLSFSSPEVLASRGAGGGLGGWSLDGRRESEGAEGRRRSFEEGKVGREEGGRRAKGAREMLEMGE